MSSNRPSVLITGGAKRIGAAIAHAFGDAGWHVVIHYGRSKAQAEALCETLPSAEIISCNLDDWYEGPAMVRALASRLDDWRVLINCAGVFELDTADGLDPATFDTAMQVNAGTPARIAQTYLAHARSHKGRCLIQVTDQKLENPNPDFFSYTMSKHALAATVPMLSMARECTDDRVYGLAPGAILASHDQTEAESEISHRMNLLRKRALPEDVARTALFMAQGCLASGTIVHVDAGQHLVPQPRDVLFLARA